MSYNLEQSIEELKKLFEIFTKNKETLILEIQQIFTKIRNSLNEREDQLLLKVTQIYNEFLIKEDLIKEGEKLPNKIKISLEKGKIIDKEWNENKINSMIYDCINIENNINNIKQIDESIKKLNSNKNLEIKFNPEKDGINDFLNKIQSFGQIIYINKNINKQGFKYKFRKCPNEIEKEKMYIVKGEKENIITKTERSSWVGILCESNFENLIEYKWKIKILKSQCKAIMFGVAPIDFDINISLYDKCGWYLYCFYTYSNPRLYSGPPHNFTDEKTNCKKIKDELIVVMNMINGSLKYIIDNEEYEAYTNIPTNIPLTPAVFLYNKNDTVEISEC